MIAPLIVLIAIEFPILMVAFFDIFGDWLRRRPAAVDERPLEPQPERTIMIDGRPVKFRRLPEGEADRLLVNNPVIYRDVDFKTGEMTWKKKATK